MKLVLKELQSQFQFQVSLLKLMNVSQENAGTTPAPDAILAHENLRKELERRAPGSSR
jgi:hypothetical protein